MIKHKKLVVFLFLIIVLVFAVLVLFNKKPHYQSYSRDNAQELVASEIISLNGIKEDGFTCTGVVYDPKSCSFYVGDAGKTKPDDEIFRAVIRQVSVRFDEQIRIFECYTQFESMRDIQGVVIDNTRNIWLCSYGENLIRCIDQEENQICSHRVNKPSGIAYDSSNDTFWVLTDQYLIHFNRDFNEISKYSFRVAGQDQLFFDEKQNLIYITAGNDYHGDSFVYTFDIDNEAFELKYILKDSFAIEGISIIEDNMYIFNDGLYHDAEVPVNQVNIYHLQ